MMQREHRDIPIELIDEPDAPSRLAIDPDKMAELIESIREHGQLQPGGVVPNGDRFTISYGHRRFLAVRDVGRPTYSAYVYASSTEAMLGAQLDENVIRHDLSPVEEAYWFAQLMEALGGGTDELAARLHKPRAYVERRLNLLRGDPFVLESLRTGDLTLGVAELLNGVPDESARRYFLDCAVRLHAKTRTVQQWIAEWKARGAGSSLPDVPASPAAAAEQAIAEPPKPTCAFCGSSEDAYLLEFEWIHKHCRRARNNILDAQLEQGPVRHG